VTGAVLMAGLAGVAGVLAAWDMLVVAERDGGRIVRPLLESFARAGRGGAAATTAERRRLVALLAGALLAGGWLVAGPLPALVLAAGAPLAGRAVLRARRRRWRAELAAGAPVIARALADALSGGHSVRGALVEVARREGVPGAAGAELARVARALAIGERTDGVLEALRARAGAPAYDALVAAILLQREAGGDLAGRLRELAVALEDAARTALDAHAVTAQARFTGTLVAGLPAGAAMLAELAHPGLVAAMLHFGLSAALLVAAALFQVLGLLVVRRLARLGG